MALAPSISESSADNVRGISSNISKLYARYILPIEQVRSLDVGSPSANRAVESRTHAFYRMVGFPVVAADGTFYNPGHLWPPNAQILESQNFIDIRVSDEIRRMSDLRESETRNRIELFEKQGLFPTVFAMAMSIEPKLPFNNMNKDLGFGQFDNQQFSSPWRQSCIESHFTPRSDTWDDINDSVFVAHQEHKLRPFTTTPSIEKTVQEGWRRFCQPFLPVIADKRAVLFEGRGAGDRFLKRPIIEQVLRYRLRQSRDVDLEAVIVQMLRGESNQVLNKLTVSDLKQMAQALLAKDEITDEEVVDALRGSSSFELLMTNSYIKTIIKVVEIFHTALINMSKVFKEISWTPAPEKLGPESGAGVLAYFVLPVQATSLELELNKFTVKAALAKQNDELFSGDGLGTEDFAMPQTPANSSNLYENEIKKRKARIASATKLGFASLKEIEIITGEVSGLGLIDILAIWMALWTIDLNILLGMIDNDAYERLKRQIKSSNDVSDVAAGKNSYYDASLQSALGLSRPDIITCMTEFEKLVMNILDFADGAFEREMKVKKSEAGRPASG